MPSLAQTTRSEQVLEILTKEILTGQYRAGERLPSERELAVRFATNRGAVREALSRLEQLGIARVRPGGTRVVPVGEATLDVIGALLKIHDQPAPELVEHMIETLTALTTVAARATAERAPAATIDALRKKLARLRATISDATTFLDTFVALNKDFIQSSGNLVLRLINNSLHLQFANHARPIPADFRIAPELIDALDTSLAARDAQRTAKAMGALMEAVGAQILATVQGQRRTEPDT